MDKNLGKKNKNKMNFTRFTNLLYEASSSLVPGTGKLDSTLYSGHTEEDAIKKNRE